jgi:hypothetical protein
MSRWFSLITYSMAQDYALVSYRIQGFRNSFCEVKIFARAEVVRLMTVLRGGAIYRYANATAADIRMHAWQQNEKRAG